MISVGINLITESTNHYKEDGRSFSTCRFGFLAFHYLDAFVQRYDQIGYVVLDVQSLTMYLRNATV